MNIEIWIVITVAAAFLQNVRSMLQKRLTDLEAQFAAFGQSQKKK